MSAKTDVALGIDIGTTSSKAVARPVSPRATPDAGPSTAYAEQRTPWHTGSCGQTEIGAPRLLDVAVELIGSAAAEAESAWGPVRVRSIGVTGLAESGVLLDAAARPAAAVIAWFDRRGEHELEQAAREFPVFAATFEAATGLRWSSQASIAKLLWLRAGGYRPRTHRDPALNAQWVFDQGGDALKFFVQLRADRPAPAPGEPDLVAEALAVCTEIIRDCRAMGVPVVIENLVYARPGEDLSGQAREDAIIEAARALNDLDIDLLKLEYPGSPEGCRRLASILGRPWAVLSAGVPFEQFTDIITIAADEGGASGFIAGRSVWREVVSLRTAASGVPRLGSAAAAEEAHHGRRALGTAVDRGPPAGRPGHVTGGELTPGARQG